jgi:hypothetical protein
MKRRVQITGLLLSLSASALVVAAGKVPPRVTAMGQISPSDGGAWSPVYSLGFTSPVHLHVLPDGRILMWDYEDAMAATNTWTWNPPTWPAGGTAPATAELPQVIPNTHTTLFCSGHAFLPDGRLLVAGGGHGASDRVAHTNIFDYRTSAWSAGPDMPAVRAGSEAENYPLLQPGRWYPTVTALQNGEMLITAGESDAGRTNNTPIVLSRRGIFRALYANGQPAAAPWEKWYPFVFAATPALGPGNGVFRAGGSDSVANATGFLNTDSAQWSYPTAARVKKYYASAVMYDAARVLVMGGGNETGGCGASAELSATSAAETAQLDSITGGNGYVGAQWQTAASMAYAREYPNATMLPNGQVFVSGGVNAGGAVLAGEMWNPATGQWTTMASAARTRGYHATAALLPDGRVLTGGHCSERTAEIYSPPYLFQGPRPAYSADPPTAVYHNQTFTVPTGEGALDYVSWVRLSSTTHGFNTNQRFAKTTAAAVSGGFSITAPAAQVLPPGHYMVFLVRNGVPSVAKTIRLVGSDPAHLAIFRPGASGDNWFVREAVPGGASIQVGRAGVPYASEPDLVPVPGDYDGDGSIDMAVWRPTDGKWYITKSSTGFTSSFPPILWGRPDLGADWVPVPADYDGDKVTDIAMWNRSTGFWYVLTSRSGFTTEWRPAERMWGDPAPNLSFVPVPGDYDGDGFADRAVWSRTTGRWYVWLSKYGDSYPPQSEYDRGLWPPSGLTSQFIAVPGDYDGDGRTDLAVWRAPTSGIAGEWSVQTTGPTADIVKTVGAVPEGWQPVVGDFDGDGRTDMTVWRPSDGQWFILSSAGNVTSRFTQWVLPGTWGSQPTDIPLPRPAR